MASVMKKKMRTLMRTFRKRFRQDPVGIFAIQPDIEIKHRESFKIIYELLRNTVN
jgi:hypothetical protein